MYGVRNRQESLYDQMIGAMANSVEAFGLPATAAVLLERAGVHDASLNPFEHDASTRRYFRVAGSAMLLMEDRENPQDFAAYQSIARHLNALGLSAPRVIDTVQNDRLALIEDFGDNTYAHCLARGDNETGLYKLAVDTLLQLHHDTNARKIERPLYDMQTHLDELSIFSNWFAPAVAPDIDVSTFDEKFRKLWRKALVAVAQRHETLVLRDFHVDNLMLLEARKGVARCGLLDFQDAILGPCEYDLVSLLQDARRDLDGETEESLLQYYCENAPPSLGGAIDIRQRYALLGAQRHARILGVFVRLLRRDYKSRYMEFIMRPLRQFRAALVAAGLDEVSEFLDEALPGWAEKTANLRDTLSNMQRI